MNNNIITKKYYQLSIEERENIMLLKYSGKTQKEIADKINRNQSTISRELSRNSAKLYKKCYSAIQAHKRYQNRKYFSHKKERIKNKKLRKIIIKLLKKYYSPELISGILKLKYKTLYTCHESIYMWIYHERKELIKYLWSQRKKRRKRLYFHKKRAIKIQNRIMIDKRPAKVDHRKEIGHYEVDTIISRESKKSLLVIHERATRKTMISKLKEKSAAEVERVLKLRLSNIPEKYRKSITFDNGTENANHEKIGKKLKMKTYFCNPYHSWEKGSVEHVIGRIRFFFPKKTDFAKIKTSSIKKIEKWLNNKPRKVLNYKTPNQCLNYALIA